MMNRRQYILMLLQNKANQEAILCHNRLDR